jgi:hypothetical protein
MKQIRKKIKKIHRRYSRKLVFLLFELRVLNLEDEKRNIIKSGSVVLSLLAAIIFAVFSVSQPAGAATPEQVFRNMVPGVWSDGILAKINKRELFVPVKYNLTAKNMNPAEEQLFKSLNVRVRYYNLDSGQNIDEMPIVYEGPLSTMNINYLSSAVEAIIGSDRLFYVQFRLDPETDNQWQGKTVNFSNVVSRQISFFE